MKLTAILFIIGWSLQATAQTLIPFDSRQWTIEAEQSRVEDFQGKKALFLKKGMAYAKEAQLQDGIIEFDIAFPQERGFTGVTFRMQDTKNYEEFYLRPHQSGNPDANQYTPVYESISSWQLYHGQGYGVPVKYRFNQWFHVKLVISGSRGEVFIDDMSKAVLSIPVLKRTVKTGMLGIYANGNVGSYFANFTYTPQSNPVLTSTFKPEAPMPPHTIAEWQVSSPFAGDKLDKLYRLTSAQKDNLAWQKLTAETTGTANLAAISTFDNEHNTVFAKVVITADNEQIKKLHLGFSDKATVYFNDQILYSGHDKFLSRDYRFLGTIGYFDEVFLPLKKGRNELWIAVSETFGGWGLKAKMEDSEGIKIEK
ncbi:hypothetical protein DR864_13445 [Runella rosea]|uniref:DUF1080 domain-containing protein n=1 Tax=Runella rosea TaxID=2259595 RepID=A0A344TJ65_9BACT|nr:hypothetical protein [Runella rosea]AXE18686.1 hypothetical protein DR864_13445 [Runella rosea]